MSSIVKDITKETGVGDLAYYSPSSEAELYGDNSMIEAFRPLGGMAESIRNRQQAEAKMERDERKKDFEKQREAEYRSEIIQLYKKQKNNNLSDAETLELKTRIDSEYTDVSDTVKQAAETNTFGGRYAKLAFSAKEQKIQDDLDREKDQFNAWVKYIAQYNPSIMEMSVQQQHKVVSETVQKVREARVIGQQLRNPNTSKAQRESLLNRFGERVSGIDYAVFEKMPKIDNALDALEYENQLAAAYSHITDPVTARIAAERDAQPFKNTAKELGDALKLDKETSENLVKHLQNENMRQLYREDPEAFTLLTNKQLQDTLISVANLTGDQEGLQTLMRAHKKAIEIGRQNANSIPSDINSTLQGTNELNQKLLSYNPEGLNAQSAYTISKGSLASSQAMFNKAANVIHPTNEQINQATLQLSPEDRQNLVNNVGTFTQQTATALGICRSNGKCTEGQIKKLVGELRVQTAGYLSAALANISTLVKNPVLSGGTFKYSIGKEGDVQILKGSYNSETGHTTWNDVSSGYLFDGADQKQLASLNRYLANLRERAGIPREEFSNFLKDALQAQNLNGAFNTETPLAERVGEAVIRTTKMAGEGAADLGDKLVGFLKTTGGLAAEGAEDLGGKIINFLKETGQLASEGAKEIGSKIAETQAKDEKEFGDAFEKFFETNPIERAGNAVIDASKKVGEMAVEGAKDIAGNLLTTPYNKTDYLRAMTEESPKEEAKPFGTFSGKARVMRNLISMGFSEKEATELAKRSGGLLFTLADKLVHKPILKGEKMSEEGMQKIREADVKVGEITSQLAELSKAGVAADSALGRALNEEGFRAKPYKDSKGIKTIGIGWNLESFKGLAPEVKEKILNIVPEGADVENITMEQALQVAGVFLEDAVKDLQQKPYWNSLDSEQKEALLDMRYQLGERRFNSFKKLNKALENNDKSRMALEIIDSDYFRQVPLRALRVIRDLVF